MITIAPGLSVKTRLPLTVWILAGLVTLFSMGSSLVQYVAPEQTASAAEQATKPAKEAYRASVNW
jgi:hypothetical protein